MALSDAEIIDQLVCLLPDGFELTEQEWSLIVEEWKLRRAEGRQAFISAEDVLDVVNRERQ